MALTAASRLGYDPNKFRIVPMNRKKLTDFFTSGLGLLILGFVLTTICGSFINWSYTKANWNRDKDFELFKSQLTKHDELLTDLSKTTGARVYRVQRVLWNLDQPASDLTEEKTWCLDARAKAEIDTRWTEYDKTVVDWNLTYRDYKRRIQLLAGDDFANKFFEASERTAQSAKEECITGAFEQLHKKIKSMHVKAKDLETVDRDPHDSAQKDIDNLYDQLDRYMTDLSKKFQDLDKSLNPLESRQKSQDSSRVQAPAKGHRPSS